MRSGVNSLCASAVVVIPATSLASTVAPIGNCESGAASQSRTSDSSRSPRALLLLLVWLCATLDASESTDNASNLLDLLAPPGVMWHQYALTQGEHLKLLASGIYVSQPFCDVCQPSASIGSWTEHDGDIELNPAHPAAKPSPFEPGLRKRLLLKFANHGCVALMDAATFKRIGFNGLAAFIVGDSPACKDWGNLKYRDGWVRSDKPLERSRG
jgi:hypothetical protein